MKKRLAAIDIGTNTILMLISEIDEQGKISQIRDEHRIARLGEELIKTGEIHIQSVDRANKILSEYARICEEEKVNSIKLVATSAMREASNGREVLNKLKNQIGGEFQIISGDDEAYLSFLGTVENSSDSTVIDIGGGSTEFIRGNNYKITNRKSFPTGAVKITEKFISSHPPLDDIIKKIKRHIQEVIGSNLNEYKSENIYAVAGTPVTIASVASEINEFNQERLNGYKLTITEIERVLNIFLLNDLEYLIKKLNIHPRRADVITAGTMILLESLRALNAEFVTVSTKGLRYGIINSFKKQIIV